MNTYQDHHKGRGAGPVNAGDVTHSWADHTFRALAWCYGIERAIEIRAGRDQRTNADIARWRSLGEPKGGRVA